MPLDLTQFNVMGYLWDSLTKTSDGEHVVLTSQDIENLWNIGFIDTIRVPLTEWKNAFEPYRQGDGSYRVNRNAFLAFERYRYTGEIRIPFDAMRINEGQYTDEGLLELFEQSVVPSCNLSSAERQQFLDQLKTTYRQKNGLIKIGKNAKLSIQKLLEQHPSPLRNLELLFDHMIEKGFGKETEQKVRESLVAKQKTLQREQRSQFTSQPTTRAEANARKLKAITKSREKQTSLNGTPTTELKRIKRSRGIRG